MHILKLQADYLVNKLRTVSFAGQNVFRNRLYELQDREMPCILVNFQNETLSKDEGRGRNHPILNRVATYQIASVFKVKKTGEETEDLLFEAQREIETILGNESLLTDSPFQFLNILGSNMEISGDGDTPIGVLIINIQVISKTRSGFSENPLT